MSDVPWNPVPGWDVPRDYYAPDVDDGEASNEAPKGRDDWTPDFPAITPDAAIKFLQRELYILPLPCIGVVIEFH